MDELIKKIDIEIEKFKPLVLDLLKRLISFKSTVENTKGISLYCADILREIGLEVELKNLADMETRFKNNRYRDLNNAGINYKNKFNIVAKYKSRERNRDGKSIIFNGHLDVVPSGPLELWDSNPWKACIKDNKVFGRGAIDMKGGISCAIVALTILKEMEIELFGDVIIELVIDEELGGNSTLYNVLDGVNADAAIFCEPTGLKSVIVGSRGGISFHIEFYNKVSANIDDRGDNWKIFNFLKIIIDAIKDFAELRKKVKKGIFSEFDNPVPIYIGRINCGCWLSSIPNKIEIEGIIGILTNDDLNELKKSFNKFLIDYLNNRSDLSEENRFILDFDRLLVEPFLQESNLEIALLAKRIICDRTHYNPSITVSNYGSDQRLRAIYGREDTIMLGPSGGNAHCANEYVLIDSLYDCLKVYTNFILEWCNYKK